MVSSYHYIRDPQEIYRRSFAQVRSEAALDDLPQDVASVATRLIHACGMPDILADLRYSDDVGAVGCAALAAGAPIIADCRMVAEGVIKARLPADNPVLCTLNDPTVPALARDQATTRSAAAVTLWQPHLAGAVVAIGNAPTALFRLLELLDEGAPPPAALLAFPVGFVGAAESKDALVARGGPVPFMTLLGRRGGSPMAAAAVNALASAKP